MDSNFNIDTLFRYNLIILICIYIFSKYIDVSLSQIVGVGTAVIIIKLWKDHTEHLDNIIIEDIDIMWRIIDPLEKYPFLFFNPKIIYFFYHSRDLTSHNNDVLDECLKNVNSIFQVKYRLLKHQQIKGGDEYQMVRDFWMPNVLNSFASLEYSIPHQYPQLILKFRKAKDTLHILLKQEQLEIRKISEYTEQQRKGDRNTRFIYDDNDSPRKGDLTSTSMDELRYKQFI